MSTNSFDAFIAATRPSKDLQVKALQEIRRMSNHEKIVSLGEYFSKMLGIRIPTRPQVFEWSRYTNLGDNTIKIRQPVPYRVSEAPPRMLIQ